MSMPSKELYVHQTHYLRLLASSHRKSLSPYSLHNSLRLLEACDDRSLGFNGRRSGVNIQFEDPKYTVAIY